MGKNSHPISYLTLCYYNILFSYEGRDCRDTARRVIRRQARRNGQNMRRVDIARWGDYGAGCSRCVQGHTYRKNSYPD